VAELDQLTIVLVLAFVLYSVWLIGLTYLMWRDHQRKKMAKEVKEEPKEPGGTQ